MVEKLAENHGIRATEQKDRNYFRVRLLPRARRDAVRDRHRRSGLRRRRAGRLPRPGAEAARASWSRSASRSRPSCRRSPDPGLTPALPRPAQGRVLSFRIEGCKALIEVAHDQPRPNSRSSTASSRPPSPAGRRSCCCTAPAATRTTCCRSGGMIAPGSALLSPRGKVLEGGMPRFFRRLARGRLRRGGRAPPRPRARRLHRPGAASPTVWQRRSPSASRTGPTSPRPLLQLRPEALAGAALLRAMVPLQDPPAADLTGKPVLILSGASDPIVPAENARRLASHPANAPAPPSSTAWYRRAMGCPKPTWALPRHGSTNSEVVADGFWARRMAHPTGPPEESATEIAERSNVPSEMGVASLSDIGEHNETAC